MKRIYRNVLLVLVLGCAPLTGMAAEPAAPAAKAPAAVEKAQKPAEGAAAKGAASGKEDKQADKKEAEEPLMAIDGSPLSDADFAIDSFTLGGDVKTLITKGGQPQAVNHRGLTDTYTWDGMTVTAYNPFLTKYMNRKDLSLDTQIPAPGICEFSLTGKDYVTPRGIHAGSRRENVLRRYGRPGDVLWDGDRGVFYLRYGLGEKCLTFVLKKDKVDTIRIAWKDQKKSAPSAADRDFTLAGFSLDTTFTPHPFQEWEKMMKNPKEELWYFPGYAVRVTTGSQLIRALFLTEEGGMLTGRGLAMGDSASTADLLYGPPAKTESSAHEADPRTTYVYFSKDKTKILLLYLKGDKVDGVVVAGNPELEQRKPVVTK